MVARFEIVCLIGWLIDWLVGSMIFLLAKNRSNFNQ